MFRRPWFIAVCLAVSLLALLVGAILLVRLRVAGSRLPERGAVVESLAACPGRTEIVFDVRGIPHLRADDERALWFAQGYLHARDRFFQMELTRRVAAGKLAELVGPAAVDSDRKMRIWRLAASARRQAAGLSPSERWAFEAYTAGVNAALDRWGRWVAPEIWMLARSPEPWTVEDSLSVGVLMQLSMSWSMGQELQRAVQLSRLGRERSIDLWGWSPSEARSWVPPVDPITTPRQEDEAIVPAYEVMGSNGWAVAPQRTATGRPLLANDPHLALIMPGWFFAIHIESPELHVAGLSLPGAPGVVIGHNDRVAWGLTNALLDDQDLFALTLDETRTSELIDGAWEQLRTVTERVQVRWQDEPELLKIRLSERGPVVRELSREVLALEWVGLRGPSPLRAILGMNRARTVEEVAKAWDGMSGPFVHLVAADTQGHILQQLAGATPVRERGAGRLPSPGADSRWAWRGFRQLPTGLRRLDPVEGFVAAANHDPFSEGDYPASLAVPGEFASPWRVRRIRRALAMREDWGILESLELQSDVASGLAVAMLGQLQPDLEAHGGESADVLMAWDGRMKVESRGAHVFSRLLIALGAAIGNDEAAQLGLTASPIGAAETLRLLAGGMDGAWWDDVGTQGKEDRDSVIRQVLGELDDLGLEEAWGQVHRASFEHPFRAAPVLGHWFGRSWSRGPFQVGGDGATVNAHYWKTDDAFEVTAIPSARFITDVGNWDETVLVLPVGQSGRPWSPHYADQVKAWLYVEPLMFPFSREAVDAAAISRLTLLPKVVDPE